MSKFCDLMYNLVTLLNNTTLYNWNLLRKDNFIVLTKKKDKYVMQLMCYLTRWEESFHKVYVYQVITCILSVSYNLFVHYTSTKLKKLI